MKPGVIVDHSMHPVLNDGDKFKTTKINGVLQVGDIVLVVANREWFNEGPGFLYIVKTVMGFEVSCYYSLLWHDVMSS